MKTQIQKKHDKLFEAAESQYGYFTAKQAEEAGFLPTNFPYHVKTGAWIRENRGIYRLKNYPISKFSHYAQYLLWSRNRNEIVQGVYSHETAFALYELSDVNPSKLHMTVPGSFRKWAETPGVLTLYYDDLPTEDIGSVEGIRVTKPFRTVLDLIKSGETSLEFVEQGFKEALKRGLIREKDLTTKNIPDQAKKYFEAWSAPIKRRRRVG